MIRDLEILLLRVTDEASREFLTEAVRCYHAGAYRAAVVMSMAAAMDDLRRKLSELVNTKAAAIAPQISAASQQIEAAFAQQQTFESQLIDVCENKISVITPAEATKLRLLLKLRHLCAHPSGHAGTAEEARECISSLIDIIFSRPPLMGMTAVTDLLHRLKGINFFPSISDQAKTLAAAQGEIAVLMPGAFPALATKLVDEILNSARTNVAAQGQNPPPLSPERQNYRAFAFGMLNSGEAAKKAIWRTLNKLIEEPSATEDSLYILASDPNGLPLAKPLTRERALAIVRRHLHVPFARMALRGWVQHKVLNAEEEAEMFQTCTASILDRWNSHTRSAVAEIAWPALNQLYLEREKIRLDMLVEQAGSSIWDRANSAIDTVQQMSPEEAARFSSSQRVNYLFNVAQYALNHYAPHSTRPLLRRGLETRVDFIDSLLEHYAQNAQVIETTTTNWQALARMLLASERMDAVLATVNICAGEQEAPPSALQMLEELQQNSDPQLAGAAQAVLSKFISSPPAAPVKTEP